jgi:CheY-like chemotaxis protein
MKSILVVDDEPHMTRVKKLSLERAGYQVEVARDGEEALEKLSLRPFDAVVTDLMMPRLNGRKLCEQIQEKMPERRPFIFVVTSSSQDEHREWASQLPRTEFLEKPLSLRHLVSRLRHHLGQGGHHGEEP